MRHVCSILLLCACAGGPADGPGDTPPKDDVADPAEGDTKPEQGETKPDGDAAADDGAVPGERRPFRAGRR